jgi:3-isopropylmalate dehydrogenase
VKYNIAVVPGDGIGPEVTGAAVEVLKAVAEKHGHEFEFKTYIAGGCAIDKYGKPLPEETLEGCLASDSVMLGAVGGPKWDGLSGSMRAEQALLGLRKGLELFTNLRPAKVQPALKDACVLRPDIAERGCDIMIVRELTGGIYFGERGRNEAGDTAYDTEIYSVEEIQTTALPPLERRAVLATTRLAMPSVSIVWHPLMAKSSRILFGRRTKEKAW